MANKIQADLFGERKVLVTDSTAYGEPSDAGHIVVSGSHGGLPGRYGEDIRLAAIFLNDAGVGKDRAGIAALDLFHRIGVPAAAYSNRSARIGDGQDAWDNGIVSFVNGTAADMGFTAGEPVKVAIRRVFGKETP